jgi:hypothetical protein
MQSLYLVRCEAGVRTQRHDHSLYLFTTSEKASWGDNTAVVLRFLDDLQKETQRRQRLGESLSPAVSQDDRSVNDNAYIDSDPGRTLVRFGADQQPQSRNDKHTHWMMRVW